MHKIFLGGTCGATDWRSEVIKGLRSRIDHYNPVVENWTEEDQEQEIVEKTQFCDTHLYVITSEMVGVYSIAEAVESSGFIGVMTIFHVMPEGFDADQLKSLKAVSNMLDERGAMTSIGDDIQALVGQLNQMAWWVN